MDKKNQPSKKRKPRVHSKLDGFEVSVNQFGELQSNMSIEKLNAFLNENVEDRKLTDRADYDDLKKDKQKKKKD